MNFVASLDKEFLETCSATTAHITRFATAKGVTATEFDLNVVGACPKFTERFLTFLNMTSGKDMTVYEYTTVAGHVCLAINLSNTAGSNCMFEPFKKIGIIMGDLVVHYDVKANVYKVPTKLLKDLSKLSTRTANALAMYIASFANAVQRIRNGAGSILACLHNDACNSAAVITETLQNLVDNVITKFPEPTNIFFEELAVEDISQFHVCASSIYTAPTASSAADYAAGTVHYAITRDASKHPAIIVAYSNGGLIKTNYAILTPSGVTTNLKMCLLDTDPNSFVNRMATTLPGAKGCAYTVTVRDAEVHQEVAVSDDIDLLEFNSRDAKWAQTIVSNLISNMNADEEFDFKLATSELNITFNRIGSTFDCASIKAMYDTDEYAQQLYKQVQPYYDDFDLKILTPCVKGFAKGDIYAMLFTGDSGTGKSTAAKVLPYRCGIPFVCVNFSTNIEETDLFGTMIPNPEKKSSEDPEFIWQDGVLTKAIRNGYCAILEEINFARPGVLGKLNSLLDENRQMDLANGEIIKAHPNFRMIATCNIAYEGTNRLNKALVNRFDSVIRFDDLEKDEAVAIVKKRTGYTDTVKINEVYKVYTALKKFSKEQNLDLVVSMRQLLVLFRQGKYYKSAAIAIRNILLNSAFIEEPEYLDEFCNTVMPAFKLEFKL